MTNHIEQALASLKPLFKPQTISAEEGNAQLQLAQAYSSIAIAEQLRIANLIGLNQEARVNSPQSGPVDIKTDKDSHTPRTWHAEAAGRQNKAYTPTTEEVCECWTTRDDIGNPYEPDADVEERHHEESVKFDRWLRKIKSAAWEEGSDAGYAFAIRHPDQIPVNPYESEAVDES